MARDELQSEFPTYELPDDVTAEGWYNRQQAGRESDDECRVRARTVAQRLKARAAALQVNATSWASSHFRLGHGYWADGTID